MDRTEVLTAAFSHPPGSDAVFNSLTCTRTWQTIPLGFLIPVQTVAVYLFIYFS